MKEQTKCIGVNLTAGQMEQIKTIKEQTGKSQNTILSESIMFGLKKFQDQNNQLFFVKVRIDSTKMEEFGHKLQSGELKTNMIKFTYCIRTDPTVGVSLWEARDKEHFDELFNPHKKFYKEVIEINSVVNPEEAISLIMTENS